jgi:hypothetical protein
MKIDGTYEFSELTNIEGIFVSNGRERATGKIIQIHLFPAAKAEQANRICQQLFSLPDEAREKILKYGQEGSASYFVTEPLPAGEYLQSWIERLSTRPSTGMPEMRQGITTQLRQMGIAPSPLAPIMPGPESAPKRPKQVQTAAGVLREPFPAEPVAPPGSMTVEFDFLYRERRASPEWPPEEIPVPPSPGPPSANRDPGLETWAGVRPDSPAAEHNVQPPSAILPFTPTEEPAWPQPVVPYEPGSENEPIWRSTPPLKAAPARISSAAPLSAPKKPRSSPSNVDWKTVILVAGVLLAVVALVIVIVETSG